MRLRLTGGKPNALRAFLAAILVCGVALSVGFSAAPQLHEWLHKTDGAPHECAATLMSSGLWEHSAAEPVFEAPALAPVSHSFLSAGMCAIARAKTSILEHAPPARS